MDVDSQICWRVPVQRPGEHAVVVPIPAEDADVVADGPGVLPNGRPAPSGQQSLQQTVVDAGFCLELLIQEVQPLRQRHLLEGHEAFAPGRRWQCRCGDEAESGIVRLAPKAVQRAPRPVEGCTTHKPVQRAAGEVL